MAPPAKRRRRNPLKASDDAESFDEPRANTLSNFLVTSPTSSAKNKPPVPSPSSIRTRSSVSQAVTGQADPSKARRRGSRNNNGISISPKKPKDLGRVDERTKTADLRTLFSKQAQCASNRSNGTDKRPSLDHDPISDPISEDDEISDLKASSASLVGQHARKRLKSGGNVTSLQAAGSNLKFLKPPKPVNPSGLDDDLRPWSERFGPRNIDELAVHKKKVLDVRRWLEDVLAGRMRQRMLVLKGAAGSGKTTTVRLLAAEMGCEVLEWKNPTGNAGTGFVSSSAQFADFLGRGGAFGTLETDGSSDSTPSPSNGTTQGRDKRIILIEEFPNTFSRSSSALNSFRSTITHHLAAHTPSLAQMGRMTQEQDQISPVVIVISETLLTTTSAAADSLTAHRLLGPDILRHPGVGLIEFNAIAPSILAKALDLVVVKEARKSGRRRTPGPQVLKRLGEIGDIRSAISSLEFLCLKGDQDSDWGAKVAFTMQKKSTKDSIRLTQGEAESLELISQREASLGIFHAVGKVVYNKRDETELADDTVERLPPFLAQHARPKRSQVSVDSLIDETGTDTHTFISALHENYILSCESTGPADLSSSIDYINGCIEYLSESDLLCPSRDVFFGGKGGFSGRDSGSSHLLRQDEMTFQVAVRGMLFALPNPVKRKTSAAAKGGDAFKMFYPASLKLWRAKEEIQGMVDSWSARVLRGEGGHVATKNLTDGAAAFLKGQSSGDSSSSTWMMVRQQHDNAAAAAAATTTTTTAATAKKPVAERHEDGPEPSPLLSLGNAAQREMLLDRLPYMAHMARSGKSRMRLRDLEKMVAFRGGAAAAAAAAAGGDEEPEVDDADVAPGEAWATDKPSEEEASPRRKQSAGIKAGGVSGLLAQKLVLSDDDIED